MTIEAALRRIVADLRAQRCRFAVVGGLAASVRGEPRTTRDVDLAVAVADDREAEAIVRGLLLRGYRVLSQLEHETGRLATVRLVPPRSSEADFVVVDLLFASSGIEVDVVDRAEVVELGPELSVPVARRDHMVAMKVLSHHPQRRGKDRDDVLSMLAVATGDEIDAVRRLLVRIAESGYGREKDLTAEFEAMLRDAGNR
jgi:hypothetical protein